MIGYRDLYKIVRKEIWRHLNLSFSQEGEDIILDNLLEKKELFYVDIGAFHPFRFSNTAKFYLRGGRGINIDATPGSMTLFKKYRNKDINIEAAVSEKSGDKLNYYIYKEGALNTFDKSRTEYLKSCGYEYCDVKTVMTYNINDLLEKYLPKDQKIDFMDIDIEGFDEQVIKSLDFEKYSPNYLLSENFELESHSDKFLKEKGYSIVAFTGRTAIYKLIK